MATYATELENAYAKRAFTDYEYESIAPLITNRNFDPAQPIKYKAVVKIMKLTGTTWYDYTPNTDIPGSSLNEDILSLNIDHARAFYLQVDDLDRFRSFVEDPENPLIQEANSKFNEEVDAFVLNSYGEAKSFIGNAYSTGTIAVTASTGAVAGTGTTFTADMVGGVIEITGADKRFYVKAYTGATSITIADIDDHSVYTGGTINAGATYKIIYKKTIDNSTVTAYGIFNEAKTALDNKKVPSKDRWAVVPSEVYAAVLRDPVSVVAVDAAYENTIRKGQILDYVGFKVIMSVETNGDNTNGFNCLFGHKSAITFATGLDKFKTEPDIHKQFGSGVKALRVYGKLVQRPEGLCTAIVNTNI